jgi:hypothetical protein
MDAPYYNGEDTRELSDPQTCEECGIGLYPRERKAGLCDRCQWHAIGSREDDAVFERERERDDAA